jgi:glycerol-3-phosphate acyltransferase PlsY
MPISDGATARRRSMRATRPGSPFLVILRHRSNIARLLRGEESKIRLGKG